MLKLREKKKKRHKIPNKIQANSLFPLENYIIFHEDILNLHTSKKDNNSSCKMYITVKQYYYITATSVAKIYFKQFFFHLCEEFEEKILDS